MGKVIHHDFCNNNQENLIVIEYGYGLSRFIDEDEKENLRDRVDLVREILSKEFNVKIPPIPLDENRNLYPNEYVFKIMDIQVDENEILTDHLLAIPADNPEGKIAGLPTFEPCFHLPSCWITKEQRDLAELMGYTVVNELEIIGTHLTETLRLYLPSLIKSIAKRDIG